MTVGRSADLKRLEAGLKVETAPNACLSQRRVGRNLPGMHSGPAVSVTQLSQSSSVLSKHSARSAPSILDCAINSLLFESPAINLTIFMASAVPPASVADYSIEKPRFSANPEEPLQMGYFIADAGDHSAKVECFEVDLDLISPACGVPFFYYSTRRVLGPMELHNATLMGCHGTYLESLRTVLVQRTSEITMPRDPPGRRLMSGPLMRTLPNMEGFSIESSLCCCQKGQALVDSKTFSHPYFATHLLPIASPYNLDSFSLAQFSE
ncbi:hypothetical protein C8J57DRAFT_1225008 [Mycena rebaudengoi]|nr:hypothetical protein C8J57DRAFT_1225008 [Mycena rebaudengoi]